MISASSFDEWYDAMRHVAIPMFNVAYADIQGNIFYAYNGSIPIRDPKFDWYQPVDGNDPSTEWKGIVPFDELPQVLNPPTGYVQNCNSSPFVTTDEGNPSRDDFPEYMFDDHNEDKRRSKMSRLLLREANDLSYDRFRELVFDTTVHWAVNELPRFAKDYKRLEKTDRARAEKVSDYLQHLLDWDCQVTLDSTPATLCEAWYVELYGSRYPGETLKDEYMADRLKRLDALAKAAKSVEVTLWQVEGSLERCASYSASRSQAGSHGSSVVFQRPDAQSPESRSARSHGRYLHHVLCSGRPRSSVQSNTPSSVRLTLPRLSSVIAFAVPHWCRTVRVQTSHLRTTTTRPNCCRRRSSRLHGFTATTYSSTQSSRISRGVVSRSRNSES